MAIPTGTKVRVRGDRNPTSLNYDDTKSKPFHTRHFLKDDSKAVIEGFSSSGKDVYLVTGISDKGNRVGQALHRGQFKIIKDDSTGEE